VICKAPDSVLLYVPDPAALEPARPEACPDSWLFSNPTKLRSEGLALPSRFTIRNSRSVPLNATVLDEAGREFCNFTSLAFDWEARDGALLALEGGLQDSRLLR